MRVVATTLPPAIPSAAREDPGGPVLSNTLRLIRTSTDLRNRILRVYGLGADPRYKDIDRVSYDVSTKTYRKLLKAKIAEIKFARAPPAKAKTSLVLRLKLASSDDLRTR